MLRIDESMKMSLLLFAGIALCQSASVPATMTVVPEEARCCATDTPATPTPVARVRLSWEDFVKGPDGAKRLASLEKGIAKMKSLDAQRGSTDPQKQLDYKRSWEYWANIHGYYGTGPNSSGNVEAMKRKYPAAAASWNGIPDQTPPSDGVAPKVWGTCVHSDPPTVDADGNQIYHESPFWGWHRIYLYYFERVLRWASGDDTLNLPYWDYTNPTYAVLPAQFQTTSAVLYADKRSVKINHGGKISSTNVDDALSSRSSLTPRGVWNGECTAPFTARSAEAARSHSWETYRWPATIPSSTCTMPTSIAYGPAGTICIAPRRRLGRETTPPIRSRTRPEPCRRGR